MTMWERKFHTDRLTHFYWFDTTDRAFAVRCKLMFFPTRKYTSLRKGRYVICIRSTPQDQHAGRGRGGGEVQKQEQLLYKIEALFPFFLLQPLPWEKPEPSQRGGTKGKKQQQWNPGSRPRTYCEIKQYAKSLLFYFSQTYTITMELNHALPHATGRATHALQPACKLRVLLLDFELCARRLGV
jgi:hypothetical protein